MCVCHMFSLKNLLTYLLTYGYIIILTHIFIDRVAGPFGIASVCPTICLWALSCLNRLTLIFDRRVDLDPSLGL